MNLLSAEKKVIRKEVTWVISNITAGSKEQISRVVDSGFIVKLIDMCIHDELEVKREVVYALANTVSGVPAE